MTHRYISSVLCLLCVRLLINLAERLYQYKYIIATNSFVCVITIFRLYNMGENCLMLHLYDR